MFVSKYDKSKITEILSKQDIYHITSLPWDDVDNTIEDMKEDGEWPKQKVDDLDAWNEWVEKANAEAEQNPEGKPQLTEVIEPKGFIQNEEQQTGLWNQIETKRQEPNDESKKLEIDEQQYRDASQRKLEETIKRIKQGSISIDDFSGKEKDKIISAIENEEKIDKEN